MAGFGLAFAENAITGTTETGILNSATVVSLRTVEENTTSTPTIQIIAVAGGAAVPGGDGGPAVGAGAAIAINSVTSSGVLALIDPGSIVQAAAVTLEAIYTALIQILAVGAGGALSSADGVAVSGAGSGASNTIHDTVQAEIETGSLVTASTGDVTLTATDTSTIQTLAGAFAVSFAAGDAGVASLSFGRLSVAVNNIGNTVQTLISDATVGGAGGVVMTATETAQIEALTVAGTFSIATGSSGAVGFGGAGAGSGNTIDNTVSSTIVDGSMISAGMAGAVQVTASDTSGITANAGSFAGSVALSEGALGGAVGAAAAVNTIGDTVDAYVDHSKITSGGAVTVDASANDNIFTIAVGVALAAAGGEGGGLSFAGAGSGSGNTVGNTVEAAIKDGSTVTSADLGAVNVTATDESKITAAAGSVALGLAGGQAGGIGLVVGLSVASNQLGMPGTPDTVQAFIDNSNVTGAGGVNLTATTSTAKIWVLTIAGSFTDSGGEAGGVAFAGAGAGSGNSIQESVGAIISGRSVVHTTSGAVSLSANDDSTIIADAGGISLAGAFGQGGGAGVTVGAAVAINNISNTVTASIEDATVNPAGGVNVTATSGASILAVAVGVAGSLAGGQGGGIALAGAGSGSGNTVDNTIEASIKGASQVTSTGPVTLTATDGSTITAGSGTLTFSVAGGMGGGFAASVGVAASSNEIGNTVTAAVEDSVVHASGAIGINATNSSTILAVTVAGGAAVGGGEGGGVAFALAGAGSGNTIANTTLAFINQGSTVTTSRGQNIQVTATDSSSITADGGGGTLAGSGGAGGGISAAIGAGVAVNTITNDTEAYIDGSAVTSAGNLTLSATSTTSHIYVVSVDVAIAASGGAVAAVAAAGSGASATNTIANKIKTFVVDSSTVSAAATSADAVNMTATDNSEIHSRAYAVSAAVGIAPGSVALAVGVVLAENNIDNTVESFVGSATGPADGTKLTSSGGVEVNANSTSTIDSEGVAVGATVSLVGLTGSGASAINNTDSTITAFVQNGATITATGAVQIGASDGATINSTVGTGAFSAGLVAASIGVSLNNSTIGDTVSAYIGQAKVTTNGGSVTVSATSTAVIGGEAVATSIAAGIGGSGAGGESTSTDNIVTQAYLAAGANVATHGGLLSIASMASPQIGAEADGGSLGLVSVGVMESTATLNGATRAYIGEGVKVNAGGVTVKALSQNGGRDAVTATTSLVNIGGVALSITNATANIEDTTEAFVGPEAGTIPTNSPTTITVTNSGTLLVDAKSTTTAKVNAPGGSDGSITVSSTAMNVNVDGSTNAYLGGHLTLSVPTATVKAESTNSSTTSATMVGVAILAANVAQVEAENSRGVSAYIATGANVQAPSTSLTLQSNSTENATANLNGGNGGVINVAVLIDSATVSGTTQAYVPAGATLNVGALNVNTDVLGANANNGSTLVAIGLASGAGTQSNATVSGSSIAYVNGNGSTLQIGGPLNISANATSGTVDKATVGAGGVLSAVGASATANDSETTKAYLAAGAALVGSGPVMITANGTATPTINLTVGSGGLISGGGAIATVNDTTTTQAYLDTGSTIGTAANPYGAVTITATGVDEGNNTISIGSGGVLTGNGTTVTTNVNPTISAYLANNAKIFSSGSVNVTAASTRAEGHATAESTSIGGVAVGDPIANATAAPVIQSYLSHGSSISATGNVNVTANADDTPAQTLKDQIQGVDPSTGTITFPQSGLSSGDLVQYNPKSSATPIETPNNVPLDSTRTYQVVVTGPNTVKLGSSFPAVPVNPSSGTPPAGVFAAGNTIVFGGPDQFVTGDAVSYDTNGGGSISNELNTTGTYYVRTVGPNSIKLYATQAEATAAYDTFNPSTSVSGSTFNTSTFTTNPQSFSNGDLVSYQAPAPFTFSSANVVNGDQIKLPSTSGLHSGDQVTYQTTAPSGTNPISPLSNGVPYFVIVVNSTTIELDLDKMDAQSPLPLNPIPLTPAANTGQYIEQIQQLAIGGLVSGQTYQVINVNAGANSFQLANPGSNTPIILNVGQVSGTNQLGLDGIQLDNLAHAGGLQDFYLTITAPATTVPSGDELLAPGGVSLRSVNVPPGSGITSATASGGSGGVGAFSFPKSSANLNPTVQSWVDATSITAGGDVSILANTVSSVTATANNGSGGAITVGTAKAAASYNGSAQAFVGMISGPTIDATGVSIVAAGNVQIASGENVTTNVNSTTTTGGVIAISDAEATSNATTNSLTAIGANAVVSGNTVALDAINPSLSETTVATADAFGFGASTTANTTNNATGNAVAHIYQNAMVTGAIGVDVIANNDNFTNSQTPSTTNGSVTFELKFGGPTTNATFNTNVVADPGATVTAGERGATTPLQNVGAVIALYVDANDTGVIATESRTVVWNANVNLSNGVAPVLIIGPNGAITQATGLSASIVGNTVVVNNLVGVNGGEALFVGADSVTNTANNPYPLFNIRNTYQTVSIINQSSLNLELQNIDMASETLPAYPQVQIEATAATNTNIPFFFSIAKDSPAMLDIENQNPTQTPSNIIIAGLLNNPTGHTIIANVRGDILSTGPSAIVRANKLDLTASGNIGTSTNRINADLVEFTNPATSVLMVPTLTATATTGNVCLALTPRQADTSAGPASVLINSLTAGQQVDVTMQRAQTIQEPSTFFPGVLVAVENLPGGTFTQGTYYAFFHQNTVPSPISPNNPPLRSVVGNYTIDAITTGDNVTLNVVQATDTATVPGVIQSSSGGLTKNGAGLLVLNGSSPNLYSGLTTVNGGTLNLAKTTGPAVPGDLVANAGTLVNLQANNQTAPTTNVTLNSATFNVGFIPSPGVADSIASLALNTGIVQIGRGGDLKLNGNVSAGGTGNSVIQGSGSLDLNGMTRIFTVSTGLQLTIGAPVVGGAGSGLTFTGGTLLFNSAAANTYQGTTTVLNGNLNLNSTAVAIPGNLTTGDGIGGPNTAVVNAQKSNVIAHSSVVTILSDGDLNIGATSQSIAGLIGSGNVMGVTGGLLTVTIPASTTDIFSGVISGTGLQFTKSGPGIEVLSGPNTYTGATTINAGELEVDGKIGPGSVQVNSGGILGGTGTVTGTTHVLSGGGVDPGTAGGGVGTLNVTNLVFATGSIYHVDTGVSPSGAVINDKLNGGTIGIQAGGTAQLQFAPTFAGYNGVSYDIVHSTSAYGGLFAVGATPLVEGGTFTFGATPYTITYVGSPGHDIILSVNRITDTWTGAGANNLWSTAKNWSMGVPVAGDALLFPMNAQQKFNINNLPVGFRVGEIDMVGAGYGISGNAITLDAGIQYSAPQSFLTNEFGLNVTLDFNQVWTTSVASTMLDTGSINTAGLMLYLVDLVGSATTNLAGAITGTGSIVKDGVGAATFSGAASNTYTGSTTVNFGSLNLSKSNPATAIAAPGPVIIGDGLGAPGSVFVNIIFNNQFGTAVPVTVNSDGELNFGTSIDTVGNLTLNGGNVVVNNVSGGIVLAGNIVVNANSSIGQVLNLGSTNHTVNVAAGVTLTLAGSIIGSGGLTINGPGTTLMTGTVENYYTGTTTVNSGTLILDKANVGTDGNNANVMSYGPLVIGDGTDVATVIEVVQDQLKNDQPVTVNANGILNLNGFEDAIGALNLNGGSVTTGASGLLTLNGNITATGTTSLIAGNLYLKDTNRTVNVVHATDVLTLAANVTSIFNAQLVQTGLGKLNNNFVVNSGTMTVPVGVSFASAAVGGTGVLNVLGTLSGTVTVSAGGTLNMQGGTVAGAVTVNTGGTLAGSGATGPLTFASGANFTAKLAPSGSNQVSATGPINLANATLNIVLGALPAINQTFTILSSTTAINGTFAGLANNQTFLADGHTFRITYSAFKTVFLTFLG